MRGGCLSQIVGHPLCSVWIIFKDADGPVAGTAQESSYTTCVVVVVYPEALCARWVYLTGLETDRTAAVLLVDHAVIVGHCESVFLETLPSTYNAPLFWKTLTLDSSLFVLAGFA